MGSDHLTPDPIRGGHKPSDIRSCFLAACGVIPGQTARDGTAGRENIFT